MPDLIDLIHREAIVTEEPVECDLCNRLAERGHVGDCGWTCVACCEMRPEYAVSTLPAGGATTAWIGSYHLGLIPLPYYTARVDSAVRALLDEVSA